MHRGNVSRRLFAAAEEESYEQQHRADTIHNTLASMEQNLEHNYDLHQHEEIPIPHVLCPAHVAAVQLAEERRRQIAIETKLEQENQIKSSSFDG
jgi:hypothetical protein